MKYCPIRMDRMFPPGGHLQNAAMLSLANFGFTVLHCACISKDDKGILLVASSNTERYSSPEIAHSDQGSEYRSQRYLNLLKSFDIRPSMSEKASPWQNSYKESFYSGFKLEIGHPECYPTLGELIEAIAGQIYYYNNKRI